MATASSVLRAVHELPTEQAGYLEVRQCETPGKLDAVRFGHVMGGHVPRQIELRPDS